MAPHIDRMAPPSPPALPRRTAVRRPQGLGDLALRTILFWSACAIALVVSGLAGGGP